MEALVRCCVVSVGSQGSLWAVLSVTVVLEGIILVYTRKAICSSIMVASWHSVLGTLLNNLQLESPQVTAASVSVLCLSQLSTALLVGLICIALVFRYTFAHLPDSVMHLQYRSKPGWQDAISSVVQPATMSKSFGMRCCAWA